MTPIDPTARNGIDLDAVTTETLAAACRTAAVSSAHADLLNAVAARMLAMLSWIDGAKVDLDGYDDARDAIDRVRALHVYDITEVDVPCSCGVLYPCPTRRALDGGATDPQEARCSTPDCPGDWRYAAPGRGHTAECKHPADFREWVGQAFPPTTDPQPQEG